MKQFIINTFFMFLEYLLKFLIIYFLIKYDLFYYYCITHIFIHFILLIFNDEYYKTFNNVIN